MPTTGIAGNIRALLKVYRAVERYWRRMLCSRSWASAHLSSDSNCSFPTGHCRLSQCNCGAIAEERGAKPRSVGTGGGRPLR
jgi:hypothetical protein